MLITSTTIQPTVAALVALAIADSDFFNDLTPTSDIPLLAAEYAERGADTWEDGQDEDPGTVAPDLLRQTATVLASLAAALLQAAAVDAADARTDAIEAGDIDRAGNPIPYPTYRSAA